MSRTRTDRFEVDHKPTGCSWRRRTLVDCFINHVPVHRTFHSCSVSEKRKQHSWRRIRSNNDKTTLHRRADTELFLRRIPLVRSVYVRISPLFRFSWRSSRHAAVTALICVHIYIIHIHLSISIYIHVCMYVYILHMYIAIYMRAALNHVGECTYLTQSRCFYRSLKHPRGDCFGSSDQMVNWILVSVFQYILYFCRLNNMTKNH